MALGFMAYGGHGCISVTSNVAPAYAARCRRLACAAIAASALRGAGQTDAASHRVVHRDEPVARQVRSLGARANVGPGGPSHDPGPGEDEAVRALRDDARGSHQRVMPGPGGTCGTATSRALPRWFAPVIKPIKFRHEQERPEDRPQDRRRQPEGAVPLRNRGDLRGRYRTHGHRVKSLRGGKATIGKPTRACGRGVLPLQRLHSGIPAGEPFQSRDPTTAATAAQASDQQADRRNAARGLHGHSAEDLFQRSWTRQGGIGPRTRQEAPRQARDREAADRNSECAARRRDWVPRRATRRRCERATRHAWHAHLFAPMEGWFLPFRQRPALRSRRPSSGPRRRQRASSPPGAPGTGGVPAVLVLPRKRDGRSAGSRLILGMRWARSMNSSDWRRSSSATIGGWVEMVEITDTRTPRRCIASERSGNRRRPRRAPCGR